MDDEKLIDIDDRNHPDIFSFFFCASVLKKEGSEIKPHLSHLLIDGQFVYATDGSSARKALLKENYPDGLYRVFRKSRKCVVLYLSEHSADDNLDFVDLFDISNIEQIAEIQMHENYWHGHAAVIQKIDAKEAFSAEFLKGVDGVYGLFMKGRMIVLDNYECAVAIMPLQKQEEIPFPDDDAQGTE